ncbi:glutaredoxin family protein [Treponema sp.]
MFDYLEYTQVEGKDSRHDIEVYALSTCGFCKRALNFLSDRGIAHRYVHIDLVGLETKNRTKAELKEKFGEHISFPYTIVDGKTTLIGFIEADWRKTLLG